MNNREYVLQGSSGIRSYFASIYQNVALGLLIMGGAAFVMHTLRIYPTGMAGMLIMFVPLAISMFLNVQIMNISVETAQMLYLVYSGALGVSLSQIFAIYTGESIFRAFFSTAFVFGAMSYFGKNTKTDLTDFASTAYKILLMMIIVSIINLFIGSSFIQILFSILSIFVFSLLIAFDTQTLANIYYMRMNQYTKNKIAIIGSLSLLISFVNIFLSILRLFGERRNNN